VTAVQHAAGLHEGTVQALARGEAGLPPARRLRAAESHPRTTRAAVSQVHPLVMAAAHRLVEGDSTYSRIRVVDPSTVLVR
jgi:hypothetical protein